MKIKMNANKRIFISNYNTTTYQCDHTAGNADVTEIKWVWCLVWSAKGLAGNFNLSAGLVA
jgi:hypothetical protein